VRTALIVLAIVAGIAVYRAFFMDALSAEDRP
jgi:hypothetical protein